MYGKIADTIDARFRSGIWFYSVTHSIASNGDFIHRVKCLKFLIYATMLIVL